MKPALYLFSRPNWLYGAFGGKIIPDEKFAQFCLKSPPKFVFPRNTFSVWIFVLNHTSPILWAKGFRWRGWGQKWSRSEVLSIPKNTFSFGIFQRNRPIPLFWASLAIWCVRGQNCSGRKLCSILAQKLSRIRFTKNHVFGLNFCSESHLTYFLGLTD